MNSFCVVYFVNRRHGLNLGRLFVVSRASLQVLCLECSFEWRKPTHPQQWRIFKNLNKNLTDLDHILSRRAIRDTTRKPNKIFDLNIFGKHIIKISIEIPPDWISSKEISMMIFKVGIIFPDHGLETLKNILIPLASMVPPPAREVPYSKASSVYNS
jgi:hypothetical protein